LPGAEGREVASIRVKGVPVSRHEVSALRVGEEGARIQRHRPGSGKRFVDEPVDFGIRRFVPGESEGERIPSNAPRSHAASLKV
jgi:hypothetical protein